MRIMTFFSKLKKRERGVLLVDSLMGIVVLAIGLVGVLQVFTYGTQYRADASMRQKAVQIAAEGIEKMKNVEAGTTVTLTDYQTEAAKITEPIKLTDSETFQPTVTVEEIFNGTTNIKGDSKVLLVTSLVQWNDGKKMQEVTLNTYVTAEE